MNRAALTLAFAACGSSPGGAPTADPWVPEDFPPLLAPEENAPTPERIALGRALFYDVRLSSTREVSCSSCHRQANAFADPERVSRGVGGRLGVRNAPALVNAAWATSLFWHGGAATLEVQAIEPIRNPNEMDFSLAGAAERLARDADMVAAFQRAYGAMPSEATIPRALASFVRSLVSGDSRYDRFRRGDQTALDAAERRGMDLFMGERAQCFHCHAGFNFTTNGFRNNGTRPDDPDMGRASITLREADHGKFRVPTLRNVGASAPYMHDGSLPTLESVIEHYDRGGAGHRNTDPVIGPLRLSASEKTDLVAFLRALDDEAFLREPRFGPPKP